MSEILTREQALQGLKALYEDIDGTNWLFVGTINPYMIAYAIEALEITLYGDDNDD